MNNRVNEFNQPEFELDELNPEFLGEYEREEGESYEFDGEILNEEGTFSEASQMELASELLSVSNEDELDNFLGKLFRKAAGGIRGLFRPGTGNALGGMLKGVAKKVLPLAGSAIGSAFFPGVGTAIGGALGGAASNLFELELEGLSQEDCEFETARAFVRFAGNAARNAVIADQEEMEEELAARRAVTKAARNYAPGMLVRRGGYSRRSPYPVRRTIYPGRGYSYAGRRYYPGSRRYYYPWRRYYPGTGYYGARPGYYGSGVDYSGGTENQGGGDNYLTEKIRRLEEMVRNLTAQMQAPPPPPPSDAAAAGPTPPADKEYYGY
ncbi:MAG: hypothetical protein ACM3NP_01610 [Actinomycetota bacterium]|jgi:uncharacterized protein (DUF697 family)